MRFDISDSEPGGRLRFQKLRGDPEVFLVARLVAEERQVPLTKMLRPSRGSGHAASARQLAIYLSHILLERPQDVVGELFYRKRTTVAHSVQAIEDRRDDPRIEAEIARIEARLASCSMPRDRFQEQHRITRTSRAGPEVNLAESPLSRLVVGEVRFLEPHHIEAAERVRLLLERSQLQPRVTMSYSGVASGRRQSNRVADLPDMAVDARRALDEIHRTLPAECAGVVMDVCGWLKGLQEVERDRKWPRRSAKLVLRIGLEQLAQHFGLGPYAVGKTHVPQRSWRDAERPKMEI